MNELSPQQLCGRRVAPLPPTVCSRWRLVERLHISPDLGSMDISRSVFLFLNGLGLVATAALLAALLLAPTSFDERVEALAISETRTWLEEGLRRDAPIAPHTASEGIDTALAIASWKKRLSARRGEIAQALEEIEPVEAANPCVCPLLQRLGLEAALTRNQNALKRLEASAETVRGKLLGELRRDFAIFGTSLLGAFAIAAGLLSSGGGWANEGGRRSLTMASLGLTVAAGIAAVLYLSGQDRAATIVFGDYWGWGFGTLIGVIWLILLDLMLNQGAVMNTIASTVTSVFSSPGC